MARWTTSLTRASRLVIFPSTLRLAIWQLRQTWRLLLGTGLGVVAAVMIICAVPLFSNVTTTAGLRGAFDAEPARSILTVNVSTTDMSGTNIQQIGTQTDWSMQKYLGRYLNSGKQFSTQLPVLPVFSVSHGSVSHAIRKATMAVVGYDENQITRHVTLLTGMLPQAGAEHVEIALTKSTADSLSATVGSTIMLTSTMDLNSSNDGANVPFVVVGIIAVQEEDSFFHHLVFDPQPYEYPPMEIGYQAISVNDDLLHLLQSPSISGLLLKQTQLYWYYSLAPSRLDAATLGTVIAQTNTLQSELPNELLGMDSAPHGSLFSDAFSTLADYQSRIRTLQVPITYVLLLILAFVFFFVSVMAEIVVDRQSDAIAVLRSRGTSRFQIFGALLTQILAVGVLALVVGPLLALVAVVGTARLALTPQNQGALNVLTGNPVRVAYAVPWFAFAIVVAALGAMLIAVNRATTSDVLAIRRESVRPTRKPIWQRFNLDVVTALISGTGALLYSLVLNQVDSTLQSQFGFLGLIAPTFILLAGVLLFFRLYPPLLHLATWIAGRGKGSVPMLALAQMSRSPRQSMRTTFMLAFSIALMIFTLLFVASETQHLHDVASFNAGADFSGALPPITTDPAPPITQSIMAPYQQIQGVTSVALGYVTALPPSVGIMHQQLLAVDADHFAQATSWDAGNSPQSLDSLMAQLVSYRDESANKAVIPAILNGSLWDALHLAPGTRFSLLVPGYDTGRLNFVAIERVEHIESIYDSAQFSSGGILVDYQSFATVFTKVSSSPLAFPDFIWLHSADDPASVANVRDALTKGKLRLATLVDRRALTQSLLTDPLQVDLSGVLTVGAIAAIMLALVGVLTASWLNVRSRLTTFTVLRALGTTPRQIAGVLVWEQSIVYGVGLGLGVLVGSLLAEMLLPVLSFANVRTTNGIDLIGAANLPAIHTIVPIGALALALGVLALIYVGALVLMTVVVARPSVSATLRLNED